MAEEKKEAIISEISEPQKSDLGISSDQARMILMKEAVENEKRVSLKIERLLQEEGYKLEIQQKIVLVPIR